MSEITNEVWTAKEQQDGDHIVVVNSKGKYVATITIHQIPREAGLYDERRRKTNARAISAVPEMMEALELVLTTMKAVADDNALPLPLFLTIKTIENTLAKAKGEGDES